jgi:predicted nucleic acid-binding protein
MRLIVERVFTARWSDAIHEEWQRNLLEARADMTVQKLKRVQALMELYAPTARVSHFEELIPQLQLSDLDDRHVLAAAITGHVRYLVTFNLKDFPNMALEPYKIQAIHPDEFLILLLETKLPEILTAIKKQREVLKNPVVTVESFFGVLENLGLKKTTEILRSHSKRI